MAHHRSAHPGGGALLRRTGGHDAPGRRPIHLSARSLLAALGVFIRLDPVHGHSDWNHRRRWHRLRPLPRRLVAGCFRDQLHHSAHQHYIRLCGLAQHRAIDRHRNYPHPHLDQFHGYALRQRRAECFYRSQDWRAGRRDSAGPVHRREIRSHPGQFHQFLLPAQFHQYCPGPFTGNPVRPSGCPGCRPGGFPVLCRCVEQHYVHRRRSAESQKECSAVAGVGNRNRHHAVLPRQRFLPVRTALRPDSARPGRPCCHRHHAGHFPFTRRDLNGSGHHDLVLRLH